MSFFDSLINLGKEVGGLAVDAAKSAVGSLNEMSEKAKNLAAEWEHKDSLFIVDKYKSKNTIERMAANKWIRNLANEWLHEDRFFIEDKCRYGDIVEQKAANIVAQKNGWKEENSI